MTPEQARARIEALELRLQHVALEASIHNDTDPPAQVSQLQDYLNCTFYSDTLLLAVITAQPNPSMRHTSPTAPIETADVRQVQQRQVFYPIDHLNYTDYLVDTIFEPQIHMLTFRADRGIGLLINPRENAVLIDQYREHCPDQLLNLLTLLLKEMDTRFGFQNVCAVSAPHSGLVSLYDMYQEVLHTSSYSWNLPGNLHTYQELLASPLSPEEQVSLNHLEREFSGNVEQLLFFEAAAVLDRMLDLQLTHAYPLKEIISATASRLRNVVAIAEALTDITHTDLMEIDRLVYNTATSSSIPELRDRIHDFFAAMSDFGPRQSQKKGRMVLEFIEANYKNPGLGAQMICDRFRISQTYLSRLIRQETGKGLVDCIHSYRLESARQLLAETDLGIEPIALQVGFANRYGLVRAFKRLENTTPDAWRKTHTNPATATDDRPPQD